MQITRDKTKRYRVEGVKWLEGTLFESKADAKSAAEQAIMAQDLYAAIQPSTMRLHVSEIARVLHERGIKKLPPAPKVQAKEPEAAEA